MYTGNMHLARSPLVLVLVQARFPRRPGIEGRVEAFRAVCEDSGYPLFHEGLIQAVGVGPDGPLVTSIPRWDLLDRTRCWNVVLSPEFLLLQTTEYHRFREFLDRWRTILEAAERTLAIPLVERLGLRYVDLIQAEPGEKVASYLDPSLAGYEPESGSGFVRERHVGATVLRTDHGQMLVRVSPATTPVPPDLGSPHLAGLKPPGAGAVFLDFDHSSQEPIDFEIEALTLATRRLHDFHDILFESTITSRAKDAWGWKDEP